MEEPVVGDCVEGFREWKSLSWGTVSKALEKLRIPRFTCFPCSNFQPVVGDCAEGFREV
jgi:hypothetical protein